MVQQPEKNMFRKYLALLLCIMILLSMIPNSVFAVDNFSSTEPVQLQVSYTIDQNPCKDISFHVYRIADMTDYDTYTWTEPYSSYQMDLTTKDETGLKNLVTTVYGYISRDQIPPLASAKTNDIGTVSFSGTSFRPGIYVITGEEHKTNDRIYTPLPAIVILPYTETDHRLCYNAHVEIKQESKPLPSGGGSGSSGTTIAKHVKKVWSGDIDSHPSQISVQLLKNGEIYQTVTLHEGNQWRYTWNVLNDKDEWTVVEKQVPEHYSVSVEQTGSSFIITNRYEKPVEPENPVIPEEPTTPDEPGTPVIPGTTEPTDHTDPTVPDKLPSGGEKPEKIPQTGTFWYLVPIFSGFGVCFLLLGLFTKRKEKERANKEVRL